MDVEQEAVRVNRCGPENYFHHWTEERQTRRIPGRRGIPIDKAFNLVLSPLLRRNIDLQGGQRVVISRKMSNDAVNHARLATFAEADQQACLEQTIAPLQNRFE